MAVRLEAFSFSPTTVDPSTGPAGVNVSATASDDLSGVEHIDIRFKSPTSPTSRGAVIQRPSGGSYFEILPGDEEGTWTVDIDVLDVAGNHHAYSTAQLAAAGFPTELVVLPSVPDTTPPVLEAFSFSPTTVDPSTGPAGVNVSATASDDLSGVEHIDIRFKSPTSPVSRGAVIQRPSGGSYFEILPGDEEGTWTVDIDVLDVAGNHHAYSTAQLAAAGFPTELVVLPSVPDTTPPVLEAFSFSPTTVDPSTGPAGVNVSATASDDLSGVEHIDIRFKSPTSPISRGAVIQRPSGGSYFEILPGDEEGTWTVDIDVLDVAGNHHAYSTAQLAAAGFPTELVVGSTATLDTTPPTTTVSVSGTMGSDGAWQGDVTVALTCADAESGCAATRYRLGGGGWQEYSAPFPVTGEGTHTLEFFSTDVAGNTETIRSETIRIEAAPARPTPKPKTPHAECTTISIACPTGKITIEVNLSVKVSPEPAKVEPEVSPVVPAEPVTVTAYEVHPAIGIARVGPSPDFFLAPEPDLDQPSTYRDANGDLLRQGARFRVFRCERDARGAVVAATPVTPDIGSVRWTVHLVNGKGAAPAFPPPAGVPPAQWPSRNPRVADRRALVIDPGPRSLEGPGGQAVFDKGTFLDRPISLGEMRTDGDGHLIVLGGSGSSQSVTSDGSPAPLRHFANNDYWCDDASDGSVRAQVTLASGEVVEAEPGWVIVGPPDFAPPIFNFVTLYDVLFQAGVERGWLAIPSRPSFSRHVLPILSRAVGYSWVTRYGGAGHGPGAAGDFAARWAQLADPNGPQDMRRRILARLRDPAQPAPAATPLTAMPRLHDETNSDRVLTLTPVQYAVMREWVAGNFVNDWQAPADPEPACEAVTRLYLESCSGGAFFPGIEVGRIVRDASIYTEPYRIDHSVVSPGDLTRGNAVPWQADFSACEWEDHGQIGWWPAQRPDEVFVDEALSRISEWAEGAETYDDMVAHWHQLGLVLRQRLADGREIFVERQRTLPRET